MPKTLDVYRDWLQIQESARPLTHYQLLRLKQFEDDAAKIRAHYRKMNAHVRKFASGEFATQSQELLNELAKAMLCLTDAGRKRDYDAALGRAGGGDGRRRTMEEILLANKVINTDQLAKARSFAKAVNVDVRDALLQQKLAPPDTVWPAYAEAIGLPFLELGDIQLDESLLHRVPASMARQHSFAPVMIDDNQLLLAAPNPIDPQVEDELRLRFGLPVRVVLCTPTSIHEIVGKYYTREAAEAEKAAGLGARAIGAAPAVARSADGTPQPSVREQAAPATPEEKRQRVLITVMAFNFSFMVYQVALQVLGKGSLWPVLLGFPLAASVAGLVWVFTKR